MKTTIRLALFGTVCTGAVFAFAAADLPKEGNYDFISCFSGVSYPIAFSNTHSAIVYEHTGTTLSTPPGSIFDRGSFYCVGMNTTFAGKDTGTMICETTFPDGKVLTKVSLAPNGTTQNREVIAGTGKYEGMVSSGNVTTLGTFPVIKQGSFLNCGHQTGTYKLK